MKNYKVSSNKKVYNLDGEDFKLLSAGKGGFGFNFEDQNAATVRFFESTEGFDKYINNVGEMYSRFYGIGMEERNILIEDGDVYITDKRSKQHVGIIVNDMFVFKVKKMDGVVCLLNGRQVFIIGNLDLFQEIEMPIKEVIKIKEVEIIKDEDIEEEEIVTEEVKESWDEFFKRIGGFGIEFYDGRFTATSNSHYAFAVFGTEIEQTEQIKKLTKLYSQYQDEKETCCEDWEVVWDRVFKEVGIKHDEI